MQTIISTVIEDGQLSNEHGRKTVHEKLREAALCKGIAFDGHVAQEISFILQEWEEYFDLLKTVRPDRQVKMTSSIALSSGEILYIQLTEAKQ